MNNNLPTKIKGFFALLESKDSQYLFTLVNSPSNFISKMRNSTEFKDAKLTVATNSDIYVDMIVRRIKQLADSPTNAEFKHQYDLAMAGYILLIHETSLKDILPILRYLQNKHLPNLWWTHVVANYVLRTASFLSDNQNVSLLLSNNEQENQDSLNVKILDEDTEKNTVDSLYYSIIN